MKRHIKIRGVLSKDKQSVDVYVVDQTHFVEDFGMPNQKHPDNGHIFFRTDAALLYSSMHVSSAEAWGYSPMVTAFRFPGTKSEHAIKFNGHINLTQWKDLKEAVAAYNQWGEEQGDV